MKALSRIAVYLIIALGAATMIFPFVWMLSTSFKSSLEVLSSRITLVPELKKYLHSGEEWEPVEFKLALDLDKMLSESEGRLAQSPFASAAGARFAAFRKEFQEIFLTFRPREEVKRRLEEAWRKTLAGLPLQASGLPRDVAEKIGQELKALKEAVAAEVETAPFDPGALPVVILAWANRGQIKTVALREISWKRFLLDNYRRAWQAAPFARYFLNTVFVSLIVTVGQVLTSALAAYAFARMKFRFKEALFLILLGTMMVPHEVILIPDYVIIAKLGWINTYYSLIVPFLGAVFGTYFMRQHFETLPQDLFDAASIDGCGRMRTLFQIVLPLSRTVILTMALFTFIATWNSLLWPLVMTNTPEMRPLQVGLAVFNQESGTEWELLMAASTFSVAPLLIIFFIAQKQFIEGITRSGMKD
ncbi:MAG: carbohydrate ABC transporter permease [Candidatus Aureabacteria bacterium]|nr:carbohydrate ABC transporter permease [Candidatus Auribacterota bacterium]